MWNQDGIKWNGKIVSWAEISGLQKCLWQKFPRLRTKQGKIALFDKLDGSDIIAFIGFWRSINATKANQAAFSYADSSKSFYRIFLIFSLLFSLPLMLYLGRESWQSYQCTNALQGERQSLEAKVLKLKKKSETHHLLRFSYIDPLSQQEKIGNDQWIRGDGALPGATVALWVATAMPQCRMLAPAADEVGNAWAKRRFFTAFSGLFCLFFFCFGLFGVIYSIAKIREYRPGAAELLAQLK